MKLTYLKSAGVLIENNSTKILCDPWLVDGEYYGSWVHYPPPDFVPEDFNDVDYIYISHIHLDHFSPKTLSRIKKNIPVLILNYTSKFLKKNLEILGFNVQELDHNQRIELNDGLYINILAADYCDPSLCYKQMGCAVVEEKFGATHIDSMCVIDNGKQTIVNTNDCPFDIAKFSCFDIEKQYSKIDLLLVGYAGAGPYPQCFEILSDSQKLLEAEKKKMDFYHQAESYINLLKPKYYMPFAGRYTLAGNLADLNKFRGVPELEEAYTYFTTTDKIEQNNQKCIILNSQEHFNIDDGKPSKEYVIIDVNKKLGYIKEKLSKLKYDYENYNYPDIDEILELLPNCYYRFEKMRQEINFSSDTKLILDAPGKNAICISCNGKGVSILLKTKICELERYVMFTVDPRLLIRLLRGPKFAHWNNAEIGSHIIFQRKPNEFERGLYYCICFFHS